MDEGRGHGRKGREDFFFEETIIVMKNNHVYGVFTDGGCAEGATWE